MQTRTAARARHAALALGLTALIGGPLLAPAAVAASNSDNLPGGTSISVSIDAPPAGALIASPNGDVDLEGTAEVGESAPVANTTLVYVVDTSFSTASSGGCGGNQNGDGLSNSVLDCEIAAAKTLNQAAIAEGTVDEVGVVFFEDFASIRDVDPFAGGVQRLTGPATDTDSSSAPDVEEALAAANYSGGTNFADAVRKACDVVQSSSNPNNLVVFLSDGAATVGGNALGGLPCGPTTATFLTFAVGSGSSCTNTGNASQGSLQQIADATGGSCTQVTDVASLPDVIPGVIASELSALTLAVDAAPGTDISSGAAPVLPQAGPASVTYQTTVNGLLPGPHDLCVTADGSDAGGTGSVETCQQVVVADIALAPATETNELGTPGQTHTVTATVAAGSAGGVSAVDVAFEILAGPNAGLTAVAATDGAGEADFTYPANQGPAGLGTDSIQACFTDDQDDTVCTTAEKDWVDTTAPVVACPETTNPSGKGTPGSGKGKAGQNPDGFYELTAQDAVDPDPMLYLADTGSSAVFGPFADGTTIKLVQAPGATPRQKPGPGVIDWKITIKGDGSLTATDASGNESAPVTCAVAPPPK